MEVYVFLFLNVFGKSDVMKKCITCEKLKPSEEFGLNKRRKDGFNDKCKPCNKKYNSQWKLANEEITKRWREENKDTVKNYNKRYRQDNKEKYAAGGKVYRATVKGMFSRCRGSAKARGHEWEVSLDQFAEEITKPCFVVGCYRKVTGLDRIDSALGYVVNNVRPACADHNRMKLDHTDQEVYLLAKEWVNWYESKKGNNWMNNGL